MAIVLAIIAAVVTGSISMFTGSLEKKQYDETNAKLDAIEKALLDFRRTNNRLPCPASLTKAITDSNFGTEAYKATAATASCHAGDPAATYTSGDPVEAGMVPTRTLKLPDDFAFDSWGRRIFYIVDNRTTVDEAFASTSIPVTDTTTRITIKDANGTNKMTNAVYALMSGGADGHGMYTTDGSGIRVITGNTNANTQYNCDCEANGDDLDNYHFATLFQAPRSVSSTDAKNIFDQIVRAKTRQDLRTLNE